MCQHLPGVVVLIKLCVLCSTTLITNVGATVGDVIDRGVFLFYPRAIRILHSCHGRI